MNPSTGVEPKQNSHEPRRRKKDKPKLSSPDGKPVIEEEKTNGTTKSIFQNPEKLFLVKAGTFGIFHPYFDSILPMR